MTTQKRAAIGGQVGTNGEFYEGGKFLPNTERAKGKPARKAKARKVQVEPFVWVECPEGKRPIFSVVGCGAGWIDRYAPEKGIEPYGPAFANGVMYNGTTLEEVQVLCGLYNAGERWA